MYYVPTLFTHVDHLLFFGVKEFVWTFVMLSCVLFAHYPESIIHGSQAT